MGISTDRVADLASSSLEHICCSICHEVLWHPVTCTSCEHTFCEECLNQWFQHHKLCPNTCEYRQRERIPHILLQLLSPLKIMCKNTKNGCKEILRYEILEKHEQQCNYEMQKCRGCAESLLKKKLSEHESKCDYVQVTCNNCQAVYRPRDGHDSMTCLRNETKNQHDTLTALLDLSRHQTEILNTINQKLAVMEEGKQMIIRFDDLPDLSSNGYRVINGNYGGLQWTGQYQVVYFSEKEKFNVNDAFKPDQKAVLLLTGNQSMAITAAHTHSMSAVINQTHVPPAAITQHPEPFTVKSIEFFVTNNKSENLVVYIKGSRRGTNNFSKNIKPVNGSQIISFIPTLIDRLDISSNETCTDGRTVAITEIIFSSQVK